MLHIKTGAEIVLPQGYKSQDSLHMPGTAPFPEAGFSSLLPSVPSRT